MWSKIFPLLYLLLENPENSSEDKIDTTLTAKNANCPAKFTFPFDHFVNFTCN